MNNYKKLSGKQICISGKKIIYSAKMGKEGPLLTDSVDLIHFLA